MEKQVFPKIGTLILIVIVITGGIWYWQKFSRPEIKVNLDKEFRLRVNQTAFIELENIKIKFLDVVEDSRCPFNSEIRCFWEGQATILASILRHDQNLGDFRLTHRAGHENLAVKTFDGYSIKLVEVKPYPKPDKGIELSDYVATFIVVSQE